MTKNELIAQFKVDYPTLTKGVNDEVITLSKDEYEATIAQWADNELARLNEIATAEAAIAAKTQLLSKLGITEDEAKLLLA